MGRWKIGLVFAVAAAALLAKYHATPQVTLDTQPASLSATELEGKAQSSPDRKPDIKPSLNVTPAPQQAQLAEPPPANPPPATPPSATPPASQAAPKLPPPSREAAQYSYAPIVRKAAPAVVNVYVRSRVQTFNSPFADDPFFKRFFGENFGQPSERVMSSLGSGVIISAGWTCRHQQSRRQKPGRDRSSCCPIGQARVRRQGYCSRRQDGYRRAENRKWRRPISNASIR
jgi:hypothetical protein